MNSPPQERFDAPFSFSFGYSQKLLESILNRGNDLICVKDRAGRFVYSNESHAASYQAKPQDLVGKTVEPWMGKVWFEKWLQDDQIVFNSGGKAFREPHQRVGPDGEIRWFDTFKIPFNEEQSGEDLLLIIHRDITTIKEAELERNALREQVIASQKMEMIGLLSASVAHDFNNMLTIILASSNLLTGRHQLDTESQFLAQSITQAAKRAAEVVSLLLILSRRENVEHGRFDLRQHLKDTQTMLRSALGEKIELTFDLGPENLQIDGNGTMVERVLINLVLNARDAMPQGGAILVKASRMTEPDGSEFVMLEVKDNGTGMSPETLKKVFHPFFTTKPAGQGSGLGLMVAQRIMEQHHGTIEVRSQVDVGTHFILKFPKAQGTDSATPSPTTSPQTKIENKTVLLVEDEELVRELVRISLDSMGIKTVLAANGDEAWKIFLESEHPIDCVLTDVVMSGELDGASLRKKIKEHNPKIPVVLMTGYSFNYLEDHGTMAEESDVLHKPFSIEALQEKLTNILAG